MEEHRPASVTHGNDGQPTGGKYERLKISVVNFRETPNCIFTRSTPRFLRDNTTKKWQQEQAKSQEKTS